MRIDKYLSAVNIVKRRTIAQDMIKEGVVFLNAGKAKGSKEVKPGDIIEIRYLKKTQRFEVLAVPATKTIPKSKKDEYIKEITQ
ncbi:MAG: RNA-binding S4 domain-containing protein [Campylobacterota bacterium]